MGGRYSCFYMDVGRLLSWDVFDMSSSLDLSHVDRFDTWVPLRQGPMGRCVSASGIVCRYLCIKTRFLGDSWLGIQKLICPHLGTKISTI